MCVLAAECRSNLVPFRHIHSLLCNCAKPSVLCQHSSFEHTDFSVMMDEAEYITCRPLARAGHLFVDGTSSSLLNMTAGIRTRVLPW